MLDKNNLVQWQIHSPNGHVYPWWVHSCLEEIEKWDWSDKNVLEFGSGWSSIWMASKSKQVISIEAKEDWTNDVREYAEANGITNLTVLYRQTNEGDQSKVNYYTECPKGFKPDVVTVDGVLRNECLAMALKLPRPLTIIADNWFQDWIWMSPAAVELMSPYEAQIYVQEDHTDNEGNKWKTAIWHLK